MGTHSTAPAMTTTHSNAISPTAPKFQWDDPFDFNGALSGDELQIQETVRRYCTEQLLPRIVSANRDERFDLEIFVLSPIQRSTQC